MSTIQEYVQGHALFCHHDHHCDYDVFDRNRSSYTFQSLLGYAGADLVVAAGAPPLQEPLTDEQVAKWWPSARATGYGQAVRLGCHDLFGLCYQPGNFTAITAALQAAIAGKTAAQVFDHYVHEVAQNDWTICDTHFRVDDPHALIDGLYPDSYRFTFRQDELFAMVDDAPIAALERFTGRSVHTLDQLVSALNAAIDRFAATGKLAAIKIGMAYLRDLTVTDPTREEAERAFVRIRNRKAVWDGIQQNSGAVDAASSRALGDYLFHRLIQRAGDDGLPVQIHTGYLAGYWGALEGSKALHLVPLFHKYRNVRFDLFHASWPWCSELGAIGKNYPNVWLDMCWAWTMNPTACERALAEWLDAVPFIKIFAYGADTGLPWCNVGYSLQAKKGVGRVLERKVADGYFCEHTAQEVADCILLDNGKAFYHLG
jgi:predicted TIM-barrel fold metal-dependent hydrolase